MITQLTYQPVISHHSHPPRPQEPTAPKAHLPLPCRVIPTVWVQPACLDTRLPPPPDPRPLALISTHTRGVVIAHSFHVLARSGTASAPGIQVAAI